MGQWVAASLHVMLAHLEVSVPSPLTAIRSPKKDDSTSSFPFQIPPSNKESRDKQHSQSSPDGRTWSTDGCRMLQSPLCNNIANGSLASTDQQQQQQQQRHQPRSSSSSSDALRLDKTPPKHLPPDLVLSSDEDDNVDLDCVELGPIPDGGRDAVVIVPDANVVEPRSRCLIESQQRSSPVGNRSGVGVGSKAESRPQRSQQLPHQQHCPPDRMVTNGNGTSSSIQPTVTSSTTNSAMPNSVAHGRPKKVEISVGNLCAVKKPTSTSAVLATLCSSSSESEEESSDESDEESESNSSDEDEDSGVKTAKPKGFTVEVKDLPAAVTDVDVDKQNAPWSLSHFIKTGHPQVPSCMTAPEPVVIPSVKITRAPTPSSLSRSLSVDENDLDNLCAVLLFDEQAVLSPLPIDRSSVLGSMSHDIDDVFDSVMYNEGDNLPPLADLPSQPTFVSQSSNDAVSSNLSSPPPVISVIPPALSFSNGRPSIVVRLRRVPSRKYRSNSPFDGTVQQTNCISNAVNEIEKQADEVAPRLTVVEAERTRKLSASPTVKSLKAESTGKSPKKVVKLDVKGSPVPQLNGLWKTNVSSSPHKTDVKLTVASVTSSPIRQLNFQLQTNVGSSPCISDVKLAVPNTTCLPVPPLNSQLKTNVPLSPRKTDLKLNEANVMCSSPVRQIIGELQSGVTALPRKADNKLTLPNATSSPVPLLNSLLKTNSSPSPRKTGSSKRKLSNEQTDCTGVKIETISTGVKADSIKKHVHEAESPSAKHRKSHKESIVDKKKQSGASSKDTVRCVDEKRKSDSLVEDITNVKRFCDKNVSIVNGFADITEKRSVVNSIPPSSSGAIDAKLTVISEAECPPVLKSAVPMLTPSPSVVETSSDGLSSSSSENSSLRQSNQNDDTLAFKSSAVNKEVQVSRKVIETSVVTCSEDNIKTTSLQVKTDDSYKRRCYNGDMVGERALATEISRSNGLQKNTDSLSQEMMPRDRRPVENGAGKPLDRRKDERKTLNGEDEKLMPSKYYLELGQKLKHQGDATVDRIEKMLIYLKSVLMFIRHGDAMELEGRSSIQMYTNRKETLRFCQSVCDIHYFSGLSADVNRSKLMVVGLRLLAYIHYKLYSNKKSEVRSLKRAVDESLQNPNFKPLQVPSPYNGHGSATPATLNDTLSPLSSHLTPSPAGSVSSVGSAGSQGNDPCVTRTMMTNGHSKFVTLPQHVYSSMLSYIGYIGHLQDCHEHWDKAETVIASNQALMEFFSSIDDECGKLSVVSRMAMISLHCNKVFESLRSTVG